MEPDPSINAPPPIFAQEPLEIVYILTNPAMPGLVKIGFTGKDDAKKRIDGLYTTGVPFPFTIEFVCKVRNAAQVESALHTAFGPNSTVFEILFAFPEIHATL